MRVLQRARVAYPISLHGVGLSLGSADDIAGRHLAKLRRLVDRIEPALVSEHLSWGGVGGLHFNDLIPLPYTRDVLSLLSERVDRVQSELRRSILIENVSAYFEYRDSDMTETAFMAELARRTGCGILLDINNLASSLCRMGSNRSPCLRRCDGPPSRVSWFGWTVPFPRPGLTIPRASRAAAVRHGRRPPRPSRGAQRA